MQRVNDNHDSEGSGDEHFRTPQSEGQPTGPHELDELEAPEPGTSQHSASPHPAPDADGRTARRAISRQRIEHAATEMFAERGYVGATLDEIAEAAGVSKGTIFYNYRNKAELFEQLLLGAVRMLAADVAEAHVGRTGWDAFSAATLRVIERVDEFPAPALIVVNELFRSGRPWEGTLPHARDLLVEPLVLIMREVSAERVSWSGEREAGDWLRTVGDSDDDRANVAMSVFGALVLATLDRRAFAPQRTNEEVHRSLLAAVSGLRGAPSASA